MVFFRKNKRHFAYRSKRNIFVAAFLFVLLATGVLNIILRARAESEPVRFIEITSNNSDYSAGTPGAWKVTKSAEWTGSGKARITFDVDSIAKDEESPVYDVLFVIDNSISMSGRRLAQVKSDTIDLIDTLTQDSRNRIAIVSFNSTATIHSNFSKNRNDLINQINNISVGSGTNYYRGLLGAEEVLDSYVPESGHQLILLFLTDGFPNRDVQNGVAQYQILKTKYPQMQITGIQYEMGSTIHQQIIDVSDNQYFANIETLHDILFTATIGSFAYANFVITDYINNAYWDVADSSDVEASIGTANLETQGSYQRIVWDMSNLYQTGSHATMTIDIVLKDYINPQDVLLPTNIRETIETCLHGNPSEDIVSDLTPILADSYTVSYLANSPSNCDVSGTIPLAQKHTASTAVEKSQNQLTCEGYNFKGWYADLDNNDFINDDYFRMPSHDITFKAVWSKPDISKSLEGTIAAIPGATFDVGETVNIKMKILAGNSGTEFATDSDTNITSIARANSLPSGFNTNNQQNILSASDSDYPIYGWYSGNTLYYYSDAPVIYLNPNSSYFFADLKSLTNISSVSNWDTSKVTDASYLVYETESLANLTPLSDWDTSSVQTLDYAFCDTAATSLSGLDNWDVSSVTTMNGAFSYSSNLTNLNALASWDVSNVTDMQFAFSDASSLTNISGLTNWKVGKVEDMSFLFDGDAFTNIDALYNWDTSSATDMGYMLANNSALANIDGANGCHTVGGVKQCETHANGSQGWNTSNVTDMSGMFYNDSALTNIDGALNWDVSKVTRMIYMFENAQSLTNIDGAINWRPSSVDTMYHMFFNAQSLANIDGAINWTTGSVTNMASMFNTAMALTNIDGAANWDTSHVTTMSYMFTSTPSLTDISGAENWNVSNVTETQWMFYQATGLTNIDALYKWNTSSLTNMESMFNTATNIQNVDGAGGCHTVNGTRQCDSSYGWDTSHVTNMIRVFNSNTSLTDIRGLANWNVSSVNDFTSFFTYDEHLTDLTPLINWTPTSATNMTWMFAYMTSLSSLSGLQNWNVSSVNNFSSMFLMDTSLTDVSTLSSWTPTSAQTIANMFQYTSISTATSLNGWNLKKQTCTMTDAFADTNITNRQRYPSWYR